MPVIGRSALVVAALLLAVAMVPRDEAHAQGLDRSAPVNEGPSAAGPAPEVLVPNTSGELVHHVCSIGTLDAECVVAWQLDHASDRWTKRGAVFAAGEAAAEDIVWLDVAGRDGTTDAFEERARRILDTARVEAAR